jgi:FkbM family methyltransferase
VRRPRQAGWRSRPSRVHSLNRTSPTTFGVTRCASRVSNAPIWEGNPAATDLGGRPAVSCLGRLGVRYGAARRFAAEAVRSCLPTIWRRLPRTARHRWRRARPLNLLALRAGARPLAEARMRAGHRLLLDLRSGTEWFAYYTGEFDDARITAAQELLAEPGSVAVDAGANIGFWSVPLARRAAEVGGRLLAVEPVRANADRLRRNLDRNGLAAASEVLEVALSDRAGPARIVLREDFADGAATGNASLQIGDAADTSYDTLAVHTVRLDDLLDERPEPVPVRVVKADLEGHEDRFLAGAARTFARCRPVAFLEWNRIYYQRRGVDPTAAVGPFLRQIGYRCLRCTDTWTATDDFWSPLELDDVVLTPEERVAAVTALLNETRSATRRADFFG